MAELILKNDIQKRGSSTPAPNSGPFLTYQPAPKPPWANLPPSPLSPLPGGIILGVTHGPRNGVAHRRLNLKARMAERILEIAIQKWGPFTPATISKPT